MKRRKRINPVNRKRKKERFAAAFMDWRGDKGAWIRQLNCVVCGVVPSEAAHVKSRAAGGTAKDLVPLCTFHHRQQHDMGILTFEEHHDVDLEMASWAYEDRWDAVEAGGVDLGF
jgi:hypothetical protein